MNFKEFQELKIIYGEFQIVHCEFQDFQSTRGKFQRIISELKRFHFEFQLIPCEVKVDSEVFIVNFKEFIMNFIENSR